MILIDTCAIVWDALDAKRLSSRARAAIDKPSAELLICDISLWEISMLMKRKRIEVAETPSEFIRLALRARNYSVQAITPEIAELSVNFGPELSNDQADRIIAATSVLLNAPLVTADKNLIKSSLLETIW
ncbi:MAG: type II toxin-antitoxin system VapC family toxin [Pyrinomonadaceae bacterium]